MAEALTELRERLAQISDLGASASLLNWDQQTMMPRGAAQSRAQMQGTLARVTHERATDPRLGELIEAAATETGAGNDDAPEHAVDDDSRLVAKAKREYERMCKVPDDLAAEMAQAASIGQDAWVRARADDDFASFAPYLQRNIDLARRYVDCLADLDSFECAYDVLLDAYDPGMRTATVNTLFDQLKAELSKLIETYAGQDLDAGVLESDFALDGQRRLVDQTLRRMGFDGEDWRLDDTVHPFATEIGYGDVRITTRYVRGYFPTALFGAMHECGHGLYSAGVAKDLARTPLGALDSLALHESQSRLWENMVGRGAPFSRWLAPRVAALADGDLAGLDGSTLFRGVNQVKPSLIRIEADETTYAMHIILRFELEQELIEGRLKVEDLPATWNERMRDYLGVEVPSDADGVMQDVHWSCGLIGYFPTYALGNLVSGHLWQCANAALPGLDEQIERGDLRPLLEWLRVNVHQHGSKFTSLELVRLVAGQELAVEPFMDYLRAKLTAVYGG